MATVRSVITGSLRKLQVVGGTGRRTPTNQEFADILPILLGLYRNLITAGTFGRLRDVVPRGDCIAGENQRIFRRYNEQQQILLPDMVSWCLRPVPCHAVWNSTKNYYCRVHPSFT